MSSVLSLTDVVKRFGSKASPAAVDRLNIEVRSGEILALVGPSGSGKTTTLRIVAGFERPDSGSVLFCGTRLAGDGIYVPVEDRGIGMVFQEHALFPHLTVFENVAFGLSGSTPPAREQRVAELLELTGLIGLERRFPHELSGGQLQRVGLARALAPEPKLILLDEPFNNLDNSLRGRLVREVRQILKRTGTAALFVTHERDETFAMADRVAFLRNGALEQIGPPADVYLRPASRSVAEFFGPVNAIPAAYMRNVVRTAFGSLRVDSPRSDNGAQDCPCELLVRPHEIALGDSAEESAYALSIPGTITERTFHGEYSELRVRPTVSSDGADPAQVPETITVRVEGNALRHGVGDAVSLRIQAHVVSCCACRPELEGRSTNRDPRSRQGRVKNLLGRLIESARSAATQTR